MRRTHPRLAVLVELVHDDVAGRVHDLHDRVVLALKHLQVHGV